LQDSSNAAVYGRALSPDGSRLYAAFGNTGANAGYIRVVDTATNQVAGTYYVSGPTNLFAPVVDASDRIYVAGNLPYSNPSAAEMVVLDGATGTMLGNVPVAFNPQGMLVNPSGSRVYVISRYPAVVLQEFATGTNQLLSSTMLASTPNSQAFSADGSLLYLSYSNKIEVRSAATMAVVDSIPLGADSLVINGNSAYISNGGNASVLDLTSKLVKQVFPLGSSSISGLVFNAPANRIYAAANSLNQVAVVDLNAGSLDERRIPLLQQDAGNHGRECNQVDEAPRGGTRHPLDDEAEREGEQDAERGHGPVAERRIDLLRFVVGHALHPTRSWRRH